MSSIIRTPLGGHDETVWSVCWDWTGQLLATSGQDQTIRIFTKTGKLICELRGAHTRTIRCVAFAPNGYLLAAASFDGVVSVWSKRVNPDGILAFKCISKLQGHESEVKRLTWSYDGRFLASCGRDKTVWVWQVIYPDEVSLNSSDVPAGPFDDVSFDCHGVHAEHQQDIKAVLFSPNDKYSSNRQGTSHYTLVSASYDDTVRVWSASVEDEHDEFIVCQTFHVKSTAWDISFSPDGDQFAIVTHDGKLILYKHQNDNLFNLYQCVDTNHISTYTVSWSTCGKFICCAGRDGKVSFWSFGSQQITSCHAANMSIDDNQVSSHSNQDQKYVDYKIKKTIDEESIINDAELTENKEGLCTSDGKVLSMEADNGNGVEIKSIRDLNRCKTENTKTSNLSDEMNISPIKLYKLNLEIKYDREINCVRWGPDGTLAVVGDKGIAEIIDIDFSS